MKRSLAFVVAVAVLAVAALSQETTRKGEQPQTVQRPLDFPAPTPVENANPSVRHEVTVQVPTKFTVQRKPDQMIVAVDLTDSKIQKMNVGENMVKGTEYRFVAYPKGDPASVEEDGVALTSGVHFAGATGYSYRKVGGIPEEGTTYVVEMRWKIFETDIPPPHMWSPHGARYKVILEGIIKQTVE